MIIMQDFSVIIPLYNKEKEVSRAIHSVLAQTYPKFEIIVVDDGSTDNGAEKVIEFKDKRITLISQLNNGVSAARNKGIDRSKNELIAFLDADDEWKPNFLQTILGLVSRYPNAGAYATSYEIVNVNGKKTRPHFFEIPPAPWEGLIPRYFRSAIRRFPLWTSAVVVPKRVLLSVGQFPVGIQMGEDKDLWERIALKYRIAFSQQSCATYYQDSNNRLCNIYAGVDLTRPFFSIAEEAILKKEIYGDILADLKEYLTGCELYQAEVYIKRSAKPDKARLIIRKTYPRSIYLRAKKNYLFLLSLVPTRIVRFVWELKQKYK